MPWRVGLGKAAVSLCVSKKKGHKEQCNGIN
nr:MAG TPA: hypothetical protein [Caudoviricetes sp.]